MIKNISALIVRILGFGSGLSAIILQLLFNAGENGSFMSNHVLAYFTLQTNIFTTIIFLALIIKTIYVSCKNKKLELVHIYPSLHLACTFYITITMIVYWCVLFPFLGADYKNPFLIAANLMLHTITPLFAIIDSIFFFPHGSVPLINTFKWTTYPILYLISIIIIANTSSYPFYILQLDGKEIPMMYPYPFMEPQLIGVGGVVGVVFALFFIFVLFGLFYIYIDNLISKTIININFKKLPEKTNNLISSSKE